MCYEIISKEPLVRPRVGYRNWSLSKEGRLLPAFYKIRKETDDECWKTEFAVSNREPTVLLRASIESTVTKEGLYSWIPKSKKMVKDSTCWGKIIAFPPGFICQVRAFIDSKHKWLILSESAVIQTVVVRAGWYSASTINSLRENYPLVDITFKEDVYGETL